jgi:aspartate/methionine/tyrosine aminotransferase
MIAHSSVNLDVLKQRAYNLRWATVPDGVIPLTAADPDFESAPEIAEAICNYSRSRYYSYGPPEGLPAFKEAVSSFFSRARNLNISPGHIFPVDSAAFGIYVTCKAFLAPGDEAIIFDPVDFLFRYSIETVGATAVPFKIPPGTVKADFSQLEKLVSDKTKLICLCNPLNPTGKVFTKDELLQLGEIAVKHNLVILSDEIWSDIVFEPHIYTSIASLSPEIKNLTVTITGYSKSYGLAGLRIGSVLAGNDDHFEMLMNASLHNSTVHGANVLSQVAVTTALNDCGYWLKDFVTHLQKMRDICVGELNSIAGFRCIPPEGCYVAFADITETGKTGEEMKNVLLESARVAVVPGLKKWFGEGAEGYIRLSFATSEEILKDALFRIKNTVTSL